MSSAQISLVEFDGGPFDGFQQHVWAEVNDLPLRIAIPVNQRSARVLGLEMVPAQSRRTVIYDLQTSAGLAKYCFHETCHPKAAVSEIEPTVGSEAK